MYKPCLNCLPIWSCLYMMIVIGGLLYYTALLWQRSFDWSYKCLCFLRHKCESPFLSEIHITIKPKWLTVVMWIFTACSFVVANLCTLIPLGHSMGLQMPWKFRCNSAMGARGDCKQLFWTPFYIQCKLQFTPLIVTVNNNSQRPA